MSSEKYIIDLGARSAKLYALYKDQEHLNLLRVVNWALLEKDGLAQNVKEGLEDLMKVLPPNSPARAIGTAAMRRSSEIRVAVESECNHRGIEYITISQEEEAQLIVKAAAELHAGCDVVNVGGGSIQVISEVGRNLLLTFGIADLNARFSLTSAVIDRRISDCTAFVSKFLPFSNVRFVYTGGERRYLMNVGASVDASGFCSRNEFAQTADRLGKMENAALDLISPYGEGWMRGAIASNCIVSALLMRTTADGFFASDLNIADGLLLQIANEST